MIDWEFYSKRRNIDLAKFIVLNDVETYDALVSVLAAKGVNPPEKGLFQSAYAVAFPPIATKPQRKKTKHTTSKPTKKTSKSRTKK